MLLTLITLSINDTEPMETSMATVMVTDTAMVTDTDTMDITKRIQSPLKNPFLAA